MTVGELKAKLEPHPDWLPVVVEVDGEHPGLPVEVDRTAYYVRGACSDSVEAWLLRHDAAEFLSITCEDPADAD